jgi:hypothetical protein
MEYEMNNKRKLTKSVTVVLLVALASFATSGLVLADHYSTVEGAVISSQVFFNQYQAAIDHMEENAIAAQSALAVSRVSSLDRFALYQAAIERAEKSAEAARSAFAVNKVSSLDRFALYQGAIERAEKSAEAARSALAVNKVDSGEFFELYLKYAK